MRFEKLTKRRESTRVFLPWESRNTRRRLTVASVVFDAPLEDPADPTRTPNPAKAPWYFVGLQELLTYFDPWIAGVVLPSLIIVVLIELAWFSLTYRPSVYDSASGDYQATCETFTVTLRPLTEAQVRSYVTRENPLDCAGSFKVEGLGIALMEKLTGNDYHTTATINQRIRDIALMREQMENL